MDHADEGPGRDLERFRSYLDLLARLQVEPRMRGAMGAPESTRTGASDGMAAAPVNAPATSPPV